MKKSLIVVAALLGALATGLGAFAAHGLKKILSAENLTIFETGVRYQLYHVFALLFTAVVYASGKPSLLRWAGRLFTAGILLFSGSLYVLAFMPPGLRWVGAITPFGGAAFIAAWICLAAAFSTRQQ